MEGGASAIMAVGAVVGEALCFEEPSQPSQSKPLLLLLFVLLV